MSLKLRVLTPDQSIFDGSINEAILPSTTGQLGILPGHVSLLAALDVGVLRVRCSSEWSSIALMGGFAEVESNSITVLVNAAELGSSISTVAAESELELARLEVSRLENQATSPEKIKARRSLNIARARLQASRNSG